MTNSSLFRLAYLVNTYPAVSHSFIRREIEELERQGFEVLRIALHGSESKLVDSADEIERRSTHYILGKRAWRRLASGLLWALIASPFGFARMLRMAIGLGWQSDRPIAVYIAYALEACCIARLCQSLQIGHLHAHFGTNSAAVALLTSQLYRVSYSFTVHGPEEFDKPVALNLQIKIRYAAFVVAISSYGRSQLFRWCRPEDRCKVRVVHCGINERFLEPVPAPSGANFTCVGRLSEQKGHFVLIEACKILAARTTQFQMCFVGDGEMRDQLESLVSQFNLSEHVSFQGSLSEDGVRQALIGSRALVLASFAEGLPVVIMESMALGRPVISTYVAGIPELVRENVDGFLVPPGDAVALAAAMAKALELRPAELERMASSARNRVRERHSISVEVAKLASLFSSARIENGKSNERFGGT